MMECDLCTPGTHRIRTAMDLQEHPEPMPGRVVDALNEAFPEIAKWSAICDTGANMVLVDFLEWLSSQEWFIATYKHPTAGTPLNHAVSVPLSFDQMVYRFFSVDEAALEKDRRDMLKLAVQVQGKTG